jgi:hypothetical protein
VGGRKLAKEVIEENMHFAAKRLRRSNIEREQTLKSGETARLHCHTIVLHNENSQGAKALIYKG